MCQNEILFRLHQNDKWISWARKMILTWKYECKAVENENGLLSVFVIVSSVERLFVFRMTWKELSIYKLYSPKYITQNELLLKQLKTY